MGNYNDLEVWQKSHQAVLEVYKMTGDFPQEEKFGIVSQIRRAAVSVPTNIAEGCGRIHIKDYVNFLGIARGSDMEVEYLLRVSRDLHYIDGHKYKYIITEYSGIIQMLNALIIALKKKFQDSTSKNNR